MLNYITSLIPKRNEGGFLFECSLVFVFRKMVIECYFVCRMGNRRLVVKNERSHPD